MSTKITLSPGRGKAAKISSHARKAGKRGKCSGWTTGAARRNADFLGSIIPNELHGWGVACSLTVRDCPATAQEWADIREALLLRLRRMDLIRFHWVTEWQMRSRYGGGAVPHLHGIFYFPHRAEKMKDWVIDHWLQVTNHLGTEPWSQHAAPVPRLAGWLQYLSKHGSRSVTNAQRLKGTMPDEWDTAGRLWGKGGHWPTRTQAVVADDAVFYAYRRLLRKHDHSEAQTRLRKARKFNEPWKEAQALKSISYSRQILKYPKAPRPNDKERLNHPRDLQARSSLRPVTGYLGDVAVDRWLHTLPEDVWRYDDGNEEPPVTETPSIGVKGGSGA
mgnify:CR=1 FL=1